VGVNRRKLALVGGGVVVLALILFFSLHSSANGEGEEAYVRAVQRRGIARIVKASGVIDPRVKVTISPHVMGKIDRLYVQEGDEIEAGKPVAQLERETFVAARDRAAAALDIARSQMRQAQIELDNARLQERRIQRLVDQQIVSQEQLDQATLNRRSAELKVEQMHKGVVQAQASLDEARENLSWTTIYAPLAGRVVELDAKQGEVIIAGTTNLPGSRVGVIADLSEILAEVDVDETDVTYVKKGQSATVAVDAIPDHDYVAHVVEVGSSGFNPATQPDVTYFKVKLLLDEPDAALKPGMTSRAEISTAEHSDALVVPIQAVVQRPPSGDTDASEPGAEKIDVAFRAIDGKAVQTAVKVGITDATDAEVLSGLKEGENVVTGPYRVLRDLKDGAAIRAKEEPGAEPETSDDDTDQASD
jgi:HlyD family secretion protein